MGELMELVRRFVVAVEQIAENGRPLIVDGYHCTPPTATEQPEAAQADRDADKLKREFLKKELRERGIKFKEAALTKTLENLLEVAKKSGIGPVEEPKQEDPVPVQEATPAIKAYSKDDVKAAMISMAQEKGKDAALKVLRDVGKSEKLSDVDPSLYGALVKACGNGSGVSANG